MMKEVLYINRSQPLHGEIRVAGAKNAVLVGTASLLLSTGKSVLTNVPHSDDVYTMQQLLEGLGASVHFDVEQRRFELDGSTISHTEADLTILRKMRASVLVAGPLLARFGKATIAKPGGCRLGPRPIDFHLRAFAKMGIEVIEHHDVIELIGFPKAATIVLPYPSVGATENIMMAAVAAPGTTTIINAALEPEVIDLMNILKGMGVSIEIAAPATIQIHGGAHLTMVQHAIMPDRLETGSFLVAAAITGGSITIPNAIPSHLDVFLAKLEEMGHELIYDRMRVGISLKATLKPQAISFKTGPFPCFPTDLQPQMMAALIAAEGESIIDETVFENRLAVAPELCKMGADIRVHGTTAYVRGGTPLRGALVHAPDLRAACSLALAGLIADGQTMLDGVHHLRRGYDQFEEKLNSLGAQVRCVQEPFVPQSVAPTNSVIL